VKSKLMTASQTDIERRLAQTEPDVEVLLVEFLGSKGLRVFIDHPDGVTLALCERVTMRLNDLREFYALEVSSPGSKRPLTKPDHFRRFLGRRARVRTYRPRPVAGQEANASPIGRRSSDPPGGTDPTSSEPRRMATSGRRAGGRGGRRGRTQAADGQGLASSRFSGPPTAAGTTSFTGELVAASEEEVTLAAAAGVIAIPYTEIRRSNLLEE
jgi:ribosome maturation factor RimP